MEILKYCKNYQNTTRRHEVSKGTDGLARHRVATNLQFEKNTVPVMHNKGKSDKMSYACVLRKN